MSDRSAFYGGSDWTDILAVEPYGCPRRLCYEKRGTAPDYPEEVTAPMERGTALEAAVVDRYLAAENAYLPSGRRPKGQVPEWWGGHPDRIVVHPERGKGVLEAKTAGRYVFRTLSQDGPHLGYVAQCHHYLGLTGLAWCDLYVCWPDAWEFRLWTIQRDKDLLDRMRVAGDRFRRQVEHGPAPDRLDPKARQCKRCVYRRSCQGLALLEATAEQDEKVAMSDDTALLKLVREEREATDLVAEAEAVLSVCRENLKQAIWHLAAVEVPGYRVYFRAQTSHRIDTTRLRKEQPEIAAKYDQEIVTRPLRIYSI